MEGLTFPGGARQHGNDRGRGGGGGLRLHQGQVWVAADLHADHALRGGGGDEAVGGAPLVAVLLSPAHTRPKRRLQTGTGKEPHPLPAYFKKRPLLSGSTISRTRIKGKMSPSYFQICTLGQTQFGWSSNWTRKKKEKKSHKNQTAGSLAGTNDLNYALRYSRFRSDSSWTDMGGGALNVNIFFPQP